MRAKELISEFQKWAIDAATLRVERPWCTFGMTAPFTADQIAAYFDRSELVDKYVAQYNEIDPSKKRAHSFFQTEINLIYGFHKAFVGRHRTRMQTYRDDAAQKAFHCRRAVTKAFTKFSDIASRAEQN